MRKVKYVRLVVVTSLLLLAMTFNSPFTSVFADANETAVDDPNASIQTSITTGHSHTCALLVTGAVNCWGYNLYGGVGDGTSSQRWTPRQVSGLTSGVIAIAAGMNHSCALLNTGAVQCWGQNINRQLGDGTTTNRFTPTQVSGLTSGVRAISAGIYHSCALLNTGAVQCWGQNSNGQLGDGTLINRSTPTQVSGLTSGVIAISASYVHTCALLATGAVQCWGGNSYGQIGDGTVTQRSTPTQVSGLTSGVIAISAGGNHSCALLSTGAIRCWGDNTYGQIGDGTVTQRSTPTQISGLTSGVTAISSGGLTTCALLTTGAVNCWGYNENNQVGDGTTTNRSTPTQVSGLTSGIVAVNTGSAGHSCVVETTGAARCWGFNSDGQLGDGTRTNRSTSVQVTGLTANVGITTTTTTTMVATTTTTTVAPTTTSPANISQTTTPGGGSTSQTSTSLPPGAVVTSPSNPIIAPTTTSTASTTTSPDPIIDIEKFIGISSQQVSTLAKEADAKRGAALLIDGKPVPVQIETTTSTVRMRFASASLEVKCFDAKGKNIALSSDGRFTVRRDDSVVVTAKGFAPETSLNVAVFSDPIALGSILTDKTGAATQQWKIPSSIAPGNHTLVVSGDLANVNNAVFGLRVVIDKQSLVTRIVSNTWMRVIVAFSILSGLLIPANKRRRRPS